jgi:iron(III) transport system substrate-binding protein
MELGDVDWFATIVKGYFMEQKGMTEEETIDLFKEAAQGATFVDGHTLMTELVAAGEYSVALTPYSHRVDQYITDGAPMAWKPIVSPIVTRPEGIGLHATAEHPAAALLFIEWFLTDGQIIGVAQERLPASTTVKGGGLPEGTESIIIDVDAILEEFDKWSDLYDEIAQQSGAEVIEE